MATTKFSNLSDFYMSDYPSTMMVSSPFSYTNVVPAQSGILKVQIEEDKVEEKKDDVKWE